MVFGHDIRTLDLDPNELDLDKGDEVITDSLGEIRLIVVLVALAVFAAVDVPYIWMNEVRLLVPAEDVGDDLSALVFSIIMLEPASDLDPMLPFK